MSRDHVLSVRLNTGEHSRLEAQAKADGLTPSEWVRRALAVALIEAAPRLEQAETAGAAYSWSGWRVS